MADGRTGFDFGGLAHSVLRAISALVLMQHGFQKLFGMFGGRQVTDFATLQGVGGILETFGGFMLLIGLFTRPVAFVLSGEMAVAYFLFHAPRGFIPVVNKGEVSLMLCFVFFYLFATGPGPYSVDAMLRGRRGAAGRPAAA